MLLISVPLSDTIVFGFPRVATDYLARHPI
ncbi:hypothetical protein C8J37_1476 [Rhizobium sp. PP-WC-1G-195]|nr:hypothetical protein C8J37_1476 [Rhizobium sp. PP-WC-1G-195]